MYIYIQIFVSSGGVQDVEFTCSVEKTNKNVVVYSNCTSHLLSDEKILFSILLNYSTLFLAAELPKQCCHFQGEGKGKELYFCCT